MPHQLRFGGAWVRSCAIEASKNVVWDRCGTAIDFDAKSWRGGVEAAQGIRPVTCLWMSRENGTRGCAGGWVRYVGNSLKRSLTGV